MEPQQDDWTRLEDIPATLKGLLNEIGRVYAPALLANARSVEAGEKTWESEIDGAPWTQQTFSYQAKCLKWINEQYNALRIQTENGWTRYWPAPDAKPY